MRGNTYQWKMKGVAKSYKVLDNGEGIEREDVDRAFMRHATAS